MWLNRIGSCQYYLLIIQCGTYFLWTTHNTCSHTTSFVITIADVASQLFNEQHCDLSLLWQFVDVICWSFAFVVCSCHQLLNEFHDWVVIVIVDTVCVCKFYITCLLTLLTCQTMQRLWRITITHTHPRFYVFLPWLLDIPSIHVELF